MKKLLFATALLTALFIFPASLLRPRTSMPTTSRGRLWRAMISGKGPAPEQSTATRSPGATRAAMRARSCAMRTEKYTWPRSRCRLTPFSRCTVVSRSSPLITASGRVR